MGFLGFVSGNISEILARALDHIQLTLVAITIASFLGVPLGILISYIKPLKKPVMGFANVVQAVPSIALLGFLVPFLGIGEKPAVCMVVIYSLLPIVKNTATGLSNINQQTLEAAKGIGMTRFQVLRKVKLPLALPIIMAGIRISAVSSVGLVTLSAFIGASGLGYLIYSGIRTLNNYQILSGAIPACVLALLVDFIMSLIEKAVTPACFREKIKQ
ncbi:MAG: ABC transporter permease [Treponema sp.]|jgi:osmoprotectant transport system permease protein|nr:ABC transporter permease [Treponema sp.]